MCTFCDQYSITGFRNQPTGSDVCMAAKRCLESSPNFKGKREIAFFGGSFTGLPKAYMQELLKAASSYIGQGMFSGIRISTRPDYINKNILDILNNYKVSSIELGAQSMDDEVLRLNKRGHTASQVINASHMIKDFGFELGLQMMTGLYKSDNTKDINTAKQFIDIHPQTVRIYPTLVMKNTALEVLYKSGKYLPPDLKSSVSLCSILLEMFKSSGINVIRLGLHSSEGITQNLVSGPWDPAFREICESKIILNKCINKIKDQDLCGCNIRIRVAPRAISKTIGQRKSNIKILSRICKDVKVICDDNIGQSDIIIEKW